ncbi:hypothetical protein [Paraburkholderia graminis]|uniref:hypothetical protein n=1 Tax=Paraburkholderia graminis TaxID=60548 RepID=UPI00279443D1|nr:hypothetical protein [Paraburkholderia graminis]MDQ0627108.1 hypothetical protein [Paraburkholderia graminis]
MWLRSIERKDGQLKGEVVSTDGTVEWVDPCSTWRLDMPVPAKARLKLDTYLDGWTLADPTEYLGRAGFGTTAPGAHEIYAMNHGGLRLLIPAIAVIKALFVPNAMFFNNLFRSVSVDFLVAPEWRSTTLTVAPLRLGHAHNVRIVARSYKLIQQRS